MLVQCIQMLSVLLACAVALGDGAWYRYSATVGAVVLGAVAVSSLAD